MTNKAKRPSFADVKAASLKDIDHVLSHWLPNGKRVDGGKEYTAPNPTRSDKRAGSLKVNLSKGTWADFATGDKGGDLIDLVRYLEGGTDVEACNKLADLLRVTAGAAQSKPSPSKSKTPEWLAIQPIPAAAMSKCPAKHRQHGAPSKVWIYRDTQGQPVMALYRFDLGPDEDGKPRKVFAPLTWCKRADGQTQQWRWQGLPDPRPLLRLDELAQRAEAPVILCEGEKAADAASELLPTHVAMCWANGSNSWHKTDLTPLKGRSIVLWPDNDASGKSCMDAVAGHLQQIGAESVRVIALDVFKRNRMLCAALSLSIIASSSIGCAAKPVKEPLKVPQVYGYTLNQPLSSDEFNALSAPGGENGMGSQVFNRIDEQGDLYEVLLDGRIRPELIRKESRAFASQTERSAEFEAQIAQLKQLFASHNTPTRGLGPESRTLVPGDRYISVNTTQCRVRQYDQTGTHRYAVSLSENTVTAPSERGVGDKIDDAYEGVWITVLMIPLLPFVLVGWAVDKATD